MNTNLLRAALGGTLLLAASGVAQAADLSRGTPAYTPAAPIAPIATAYNWSGFYLGANLGGSWVRDSASLGGISANADGSTLFGGLQGGYNFQTGPWVLGVETDAGYGHASKTVALGALNLKTETTWSGTVRARGGYAFDNVLLYGTGGLAWATTQSTLTNGGGGSVRGDKTRVGWTVGGGLEYGVTKNISVKGEYLYADYGRETTAFRTREQMSDHMFRIGVNYRF